MRRWVGIGLAVLAVGSLAASHDRAASHTGETSRGRGSPLRGGLIVVAAGDIACAARPGTSPTSCQYDDTARLIDGPGVDAVLALGDNQYDVGALADFRRYFHPTWGDVKHRIRPVPGNHEYGHDPTATPAGYFAYFGDRVRGPDGLGYYSYDLGDCPDAPCWHLIALSSELCFGDGACLRTRDATRPGARMRAWLRADLRAHPNSAYRCTLAYWHHPLFSVSSGSGPSPAMRPLWRLLFRAGVDLVLNGHSHNYQRWAPQAPDGTASGTGIREFVVGTGGASHYAIQARPHPENLVVAQARSFGVLRLALRSTSYAWEWVNARGQPPFRDASVGQVPCH